MIKKNPSKPFKSAFDPLYSNGARLPYSAVATGGQGGRAPPPPTTARASPFWFTQNTFLEHHVSTGQQAILDSGIVMFKNKSRLKVTPFFAKILATNCCT